jgi:hypothetical protein
MSGVEEHASIACVLGGQFWPTKTKQSTGGGFDTIRFDLALEPELQPRTATIMSYDADGEILQEAIKKFVSFKLESHVTGVAIKPYANKQSTGVTIQCSIAKAATGQNLYLPESGGLIENLKIGLKPFYKEWSENLSGNIDPRMLQRAVESALVKNHSCVSMLDLTSHFKMRSESEALHLMRWAYLEGSGIITRVAKSGAPNVKRWSVQSETSLSCHGERYSAKLYLKEPEMIVKNHCSYFKRVSVDDAELLRQEALGLVRFEFGLRSRWLKPAEKLLSFWTEENLIRERRRSLSLLHLPRLPHWAGPPQIRKRAATEVTSLKWYQALQDAIHDNPEYLGLADDQQARLVDAAIFAFTRRHFEHNIIDVDDGDGEGVEMRDIDEHYYKLWLKGVDLNAELSVMKERTRRRIKNNILAVMGVDIRTVSKVERVDLAPALQIGMWTPQRDWRELIAA